MTTSDAESWARLRLVEGESSAMKWELVSSLGHTTLTVGSNSDCTWVVQAEGVRPIHFSLHWDGGTLRAADVYSAGDVRIDGHPLTTQWRPLHGRVRLEFGRAAMVVETSPASQPRSSEQPLDAPLTTEPKRGQAQVRSGKETLIGVAPHMIAGLITPQRPELGGTQLEAGPARDVSAPPPASVRPAAADASTRPSARPANERSMKATLVGGIGITPTPLSQPAAQAPGSNAPKANATMMGFGASEQLRSGLPPSGSFGAAPSSTPPASAPPARRMTQRGVISQPPGVVPDAVSPSRVRSVSEPGPAPRIHSAWQEKADPRRDDGSYTLRGMSKPDDEFAPQAPRGPGTQQSWNDVGDRMSDIPTQMRDPASFDSRRPSRGFPWRYVGVLVLTGVAYFAWLYLLDHM